MAQLDLQPRLDFALSAYAAAKTFILGYYQQADLEVERKRDSSPVTAADRGAEQLLRADVWHEVSLALPPLGCSAPRRRAELPP